MIVRALLRYYQKDRLAELEGQATKFVNPHTEDRQGRKFLNWNDEAAEARRGKPSLARRDMTHDPAYTKIVDDVHKLVGVDYRKHQLRDYHFRDNVFHDCPQEMGNTGTPSAFILRGHWEGSKLIHCFACGNTCFFFSTFQPRAYDFRDPVSAPYQDYKVLNASMLGGLLAASTRAGTVVQAPSSIAAGSASYLNPEAACQKVCQKTEEKLTSVLVLIEAIDHTTTIGRTTQNRVY